MANVYPIVQFNDSNLKVQPPCLNSVLEETLYSTRTVIRKYFVH